MYKGGMLKPLVKPGLEEGEKALTRVDRLNRIVELLNNHPEAPRNRSYLRYFDVSMYYEAFRNNIGGNLLFISTA